VAVHLAGIPVDFTEIKAAAKACGAFIIEDCAQSLGAEYMGRKTGRLGDFAFFSLCRGKGATIYEGGVLVSNRNEYSSALDGRIKKLEKSNYLSEALKLFELFGYWLLYRPQFFWFVFALPRNFWRMQGRELKALSEDFDIDFSTHKVSNLRKKIGRISFSRLEEELGRQREKASCYISRLEGTPGIRMIKESRGIRGSYPYLTLLLEDPSRRSRLKSALDNSGRGLSIIYTQTVDRYDYLKDFIPRGDYSGGRSLAERHLTLSTNHFLKDSDRDRVLESIKSIR